MINTKIKILQGVGHMFHMDGDDRIMMLDRVGFRSWLEANHSTARECLLVVDRSDGRSGLPYLDALEEALCFGWIDSTVRMVDRVGTVQRFSPRRRGGRWTELNRARCARLEHLGLMTDAGREALSWAGPFSIDPDVMAALSADPGVLETFMSFPELYRRVRVDNIQSHRRDPEVFTRRLSKLVDSTRAGRMYGSWDDGGRLP